MYPKIVTLKARARNGVDCLRIILFKSNKQDWCELDIYTKLVALIRTCVA